MSLIENNRKPVYSGTLMVLFLKEAFSAFGFVSADLATICVTAPPQEAYGKPT
jgi:hypothetical protein